MPGYMGGGRTNAGGWSEGRKRAWGEGRRGGGGDGREKGGGGVYGYFVGAANNGHTPRNHHWLITFE